MTFIFVYLNYFAWTYQRASYTSLVLWCTAVCTSVPHPGSPYHPSIWSCLSASTVFHKPTPPPCRTLLLTQHIMPSVLL